MSRTQTLSVHYRLTSRPGCTCPPPSLPPSEAGLGSSQTIMSLTSGPVRGQYWLHQQSSRGTLLWRYPGHIGEKCLLKSFVSAVPAGAHGVHGPVPSQVSPRPVQSLHHSSYGAEQHRLRRWELNFPSLSANCASVQPAVIHPPGSRRLRRALTAECLSCLFVLFACDWIF